MKMLLESLKNSPVTVWGAGREGHACAEFLQKRGCTVKIVEDPLTEPLEGVIVKSPGISRYRPEIAAAKQAGATFTTATNLFVQAARLSPKKPLLIGITGTKGKSTTSSLVARLLSEQGKKVALCGNIGVPSISYADKVDDYDVFVLEVSSYQAADLEQGFDISVVLNLYPEHIDWHGSHERYYQDKLNIVHVRPDGAPVVLNANNPRLSRYLPAAQNAVYFDAPDAIHIENGLFYDGIEKLFPISAVNLKGEHNLKNVCAALTAVKLAGGDLFLCEDALKTFHALPHRLQELPVRHGLRFVDDSIATTPESTLAALKSFPETKIVLIAGGYDRKQDYTELADFVVRKGIQVVTLPPTGERLARMIREKGGFAVEATDMTNAVESAAKAANAGDLVLLSPAAPSYGVYKNFEERGDIFAQCVAAL